MKKCFFKKHKARKRASGREQTAEVMHDSSYIKEMLPFQTDAGKLTGRQNGMRQH